MRPTFNTGRGLGLMNKRKSQEWVCPTNLDNVCYLIFLEDLRDFRAHGNLRGLFDLLLHLLGQDVRQILPGLRIGTGAHGLNHLSKPDHITTTNIKHQNLPTHQGSYLLW
eukprot:1372645-Amorphochlora_amoeboformis.AAC.1